MGNIKLTLEDVKQFIESNIEMLEMDFEDKDFGDKAKLLCKHYKSILALLKAVKE